jgi:low temperature requirement protein LtrA
MNRLVAPVRVRSTGEAERKVTWLELFFDLIFVAAVSQVAEPLRHDYSLAELARFTPLFVLIWWAWIGHTFFSTRFDTDDAVQRGLTFLQIFAVAAMAANAKDALDSRSSAGFAAAYAGVRLVLVAQYLRARRIKEARDHALRHMDGHGTAAGLWLASALLPTPERFWLWALAFAIDLSTPWLALSHSVKVPPDVAHLPERFGLFTLILLGESVVAVMRGMESQEGWTPAAAGCAILGMAIWFLVCWWYFAGAAAARRQRVRSERDAVRFHVWGYAHFPMYLGLIVSGVGIQRTVTAASRYTLATHEIAILTTAAGMVMVAMSILNAASAPPSRTGSAAIPAAAVAIVMAATIAALVSTPLALVAVVAAAYGSLVAVSLRGDSRPGLMEPLLRADEASF